MKKAQQAIPVKNIINIDNPSNYKLHAARWNDKHNPLDVYVRDKNEWFNWNTWRSNVDCWSRDYIFSLMNFYPETSMWLFGGIYKVLERRG